MRRFLSLALAVTALSLGLSSCASYQPFPPSHVGTDRPWTLAVFKLPDFVINSDLGAVNKLIWEFSNREAVVEFAETLSETELRAEITALVQSALQSLSPRITLADPADPDTVDSWTKNISVNSLTSLDNPEHSLGQTLPLVLAVEVTNWSFEAGPIDASTGIEITNKQDFAGGPRKVPDFGHARLDLRITFLDLSAGTVVWSAKTVGKAKVANLAELSEKGLYSYYQESIALALKPVLQFLTSNLVQE